jgi:hypothetical protein
MFGTWYTTSLLRSARAQGSPTPPPKASPALRHYVLNCSFAAKHIGASRRMATETSTGVGGARRSSPSGSSWLRRSGRHCSPVGRPQRPS